MRVNDFKDFLNKLLAEEIQRGIEKGEFAKQDVEGIIYSYCCLIQGNLLMALNSNTFNVDKVYKSWNYFWEGTRNKG